MAVTMYQGWGTKGGGALCGTLSTFLREDEVGGVRSKPQQRDIDVTHSDSRLVITQGNRKGSRPAESAKVENFSI